MPKQTVKNNPSPKNQFREKSTYKAGELVREFSLSLKSVTTTPELEAELIVSAALKITRTQLATHPELVLTVPQLELASSWLNQRLTHKPLPLMFEAKDFMGKRFRVDEQTFTPRFDTEKLVELILKELNQSKTRYEHQQSDKIADLCCGTGAIGISILAMQPQSLNQNSDQLELVGVDISAAAIECALENASQILSIPPTSPASESNQSSNWEFIESDVLDFLASEPTKFDLIVCNPPYIPTDPELQGQLGPELAFDPEISLFSGSDGLDLWRDIIYLIARHQRLKPGGSLWGEFHPNQEEKLREMLAAGGFEGIKFYKSDLTGEPRFFSARSSIRQSNNRTNLKGAR